MESSNRLKGKVALVTGGSRGIGKAIALKLASEGADMIITYLHSDEEVTKLVSEFREQEFEITAIKSDISKVDGINKLIKQVFMQYSKIDILISNAGVYHRAEFWGLSEQIWDETLNTNLKGAYFLTQKISKKMIEQKDGDIINISSEAGLKPKKSIGIEYGLSKNALFYLTKSLALTLEPHNIRVNCVAPGYTNTDMAKFRNNKELKREIEKTIPSGRVNEPEDIANAVLSLILEKQTGQIATVIGGEVTKIN